MSICDPSLDLLKNPFLAMLFLVIHVDFDGRNKPVIIDFSHDLGWGPQISDPLEIRWNFSGAAKALEHCLDVLPGCAKLLGSLNVHPIFWLSQHV